jgi:hypothetical protein
MDTYRHRPCGDRYVLWMTEEPGFDSQQLHDFIPILHKVQANCMAHPSTHLHQAPELTRGHVPPFHRIVFMGI